MSAFFQNPLLYIISVLAVGFILCLIIPGKRTDVIRLLCLDVSMLALVLGVLSCLSFNQSIAGFQFLFRVNILPFNNLTFTLGADGLSMIFLLLTLFVFPICFASA